jgi:hypothetical protein
MAAPADQAATTGQQAAADAVAAQPQQPNVVVVVRVNSPGDDVITQTNTVTVDSSAANRSTTTQAKAPAASLLLGTALTPARRSRPQSPVAQPQENVPAPRALSQLAAVAQSTVTKPEAHAAPRQAPARRAPARRPSATPARQSSAAPAAMSRQQAAGATPRRAPLQHHATARGLTHRFLATAAALPGAVSPHSVVAGAARASSGDSDFAVAALAALVLGLLACAALAWRPRLRSASPPRLGG